MDLLYRPPVLLKRIFPEIIWDNGENRVLLTIDDGPSENTLRLLELLDTYGLKAIFFCSGEKIEKYPGHLKEIVKAGHSVQNHGYNHKRMIFRGRSYNLIEIEQCGKLITDITGEKAIYFRPPYGMFNHSTISAVRKKQMKMMLWSFLTGDHTGDIELVRRLTSKYLTRNSIIVMHDNRNAAGIFRTGIEYLVETAKEKDLVLSHKNGSDKN